MTRRTGGVFVTVARGLLMMPVLTAAQRPVPVPWIVTAVLPSSCGQERMLPIWRASPIRGPWPGTSRSPIPP